MSKKGHRLSIYGDLECIAQCPICLTTDNEPKLLPCQHTVCLACLEDLHMRNRKGCVTCPLCRMDWMVPGGNLTRFPTHRIVRDISDRISRKKTPRCPFCRKKDKELNVHCVDCDKNICETCSNEHSLRSAFKDHKMITLDNEKALIWCEDHDDVFEYNCEECHIQLCLVCVQEGKCDTHQVNKIKMEKNNIIQEADDENVGTDKNQLRDMKNTDAKPDVTVQQKTIMMETVLEKKQFGTQKQPSSRTPKTHTQKQVTAIYTHATSQPSQSACAPWPYTNYNVTAATKVVAQIPAQHKHTKPGRP